MSAPKPKGKPKDQQKDQPADDAPVIPDRSSDDSEEGWDRPDTGDSDDERYLRDRPPHWE